MNEKIQSQHRNRAAYVYVRQSTGHQVRHHHQGRQRQYDLAARARELAFASVVVIDDDQGKTGSGLVERPGFATLLSAVCGGEAGAVFALEASRLARNNRDWHHLIDLCALTETLIIDAEGVYDPRQLNDRLLLGLKGTMSEFELGLFRPINERQKEWLAKASETYDWKLPMPDVAKVWREGCIIRSAMLNDMAQALAASPGKNLMFAPFFADKLKSSHTGLRQVVGHSALSGNQVPALSAGLAYFDMMRTGRSTANMIQAQRDFFGAHTFERIGEEGAHNGPWTGVDE